MPEGPIQVPPPSDARSVCLSFLKPFKKRKCSAASSEAAASASSSEGMVTPRIKSPKEP